MAVDFEQPKAIGGEPVVVVTVKNNDVVGRNACAACQLLKCFFADDVAAHLVLQLRLPVETDRAGNVPRVILFSVHVNFDEFDPRFAEVILDPFRIHEGLGVCVSSHSIFLSIRLLSTAAQRSAHLYTPSVLTASLSDYALRTLHSSASPGP